VENILQGAALGGEDAPLGRVRLGAPHHVVLAEVLGQLGVHPPHAEPVGAPSWCTMQFSDGPSTWAKRLASFLTT
jgi:hypothetical protein